MKKILLVTVAVLFVLSMSSLSFAGKGSSPVITCAPVWDSCGPVDDSVFFDWNLGTWYCDYPSKYSVSVELLVSGEGFDDPEADIRTLSFGTGQEEDPTLTELTVALDAFVYWDGFEYVPFTGDARARVKGLLTPGKSQNNAFSDYCDFTIGGIVD